MKRVFLTVFALVFLLSSSACGNGSPPRAETSRFEYVKSLIDDYVQNFESYSDGSEEAEAHLSFIEEQAGLLSEDEQNRLTDYVRERYPELIENDDAAFPAEAKAESFEANKELCGSWVSLYGKSVPRFYSADAWDNDREIVFLEYSADAWDNDREIVFLEEDNVACYSTAEFSIQSDETLWLGEDGTAAFMGEKGTWTSSGTTLSLDLGTIFDWEVGTSSGYVKLFSEKLNLVLVKEEDYPRLRDEMFLTVDLTEENFHEYFDDPVLLPYILNPNHYELSLVFFPGHRGDNGLIYLGSNNVVLDFFIENYGYLSDKWYAEAPSCGSLQDRTCGPIEKFYDEQTHSLSCEINLLAVSGSVTFVRQEYVDESVKEREYRKNDTWYLEDNRFVCFYDGFVYIDYETANNWHFILDPCAETLRSSY